MADYYTDFSFSIDDLTVEESQWIREKLDEIDDGGDEDAWLCCDVTIETDFHQGPGYCWIRSEAGSGNIEAVADFCGEFLAEFRPDKWIEFEWANTCSKPRVDSFGGGAVFITATESRWLNTTDWLVKQTQEFKSHGD